MLVKIGEHTPLDVLNGIEITRIQTIIDEVSSLTLKENMDSMFPPAPEQSFFHVSTDEGLLVPPSPPPAPDITRTKEYVVPRLLLLFEPINSLVDLARHNLDPTKDAHSLEELVAKVKSAAMVAVTHINDLSPATVSLPVSAADSASASASAADSASVD